MIDKDIVAKVLERAQLKDIVSDLRRIGKNLYTICPSCQKSGKGKGLIINPSNNSGKCYSCDFYVANAADFLVKTKNIRFNEAINQLASQYAIDTETEAQRFNRLRKEEHIRKKSERRKSFCDIQLEASGLTIQDITAQIYDESKNLIIDHPVFRSGTKDQYGKIQEGAGDDMLIEYFDLEGKPVRYKPKNAPEANLIRIRWANPGIHLDKQGRPIKYQSPAGSGSHIYIPQYIRGSYKNNRKIKRLFIQEGEKKAEKSCKHGLPSIGIMGIQNIGFGGQLPPEVQLIVQRCEVEEVIFMLDSDFDHLSEHLNNNDIVDQRPRNFFFAVKNYKDYMKTLININVNVEIYFGHVIENENKDKGIDDLLTNTLKGKEDSLVKDVETAINTKNGTGDFLQLYKITMMNDAKIADIWLLNDITAFAKKYKSRLSELQQFRIGKVSWRFEENGELVMAQPLLASETFWTKTVNKKTEEVLYNFEYVNCMEFLQKRGFYRIKLKSSAVQFCHIDDKIVRKIDSYEIKDYVTAFTKTLVAKDQEYKNVLNMLYRGGPQYLGPEKLSNLDFCRPLFDRADRSSQRLYFKNVYWEISADGIKEYTLNNMKTHIWEDQLIDSEVSLLKGDFIKVNSKAIENSEFDKTFDVNLSENASRCDFLKFMINASNFTWKTPNEEITDEDKADNVRHLLNKLTAMGFLLHDYKNDSEMKAVIAMDGKLSEVGTSHGRTGKSLMGVALEKVIPQTYISAKKTDLVKDPFIFGEVTEKTKNVFIDDVRAKFDFEFFFPVITAQMKINPKGDKPFTLSVQDSPKLFITTNHAIEGEGGSFYDRQAFTVYSDYYNDNHKPIDDFGRNFFSEWDKEQWNLFYNLIAASIHLYFKAIKEGWSGKNQGIIPAPSNGIEKRKLRQMMNEDFLSWAELYFCETADQNNPFDMHLNARIKRMDMYENFIAMYPQSRQFTNQTTFKKKLKLYCKYKEYHFNPNKMNDFGFDFTTSMHNNPYSCFFGIDDKVAGSEYITIATRNYIV